jgi:peptide-methionine (S)-S-oxide reductase
MNENNEVEVVTLGGGCFWCTEAVFDRVEGVLDVVPGYSGGRVKDPSYEEVCTGRTGHAEVVQIIFDPDTLSLSEILEIFFSTHDPTTLNRQGADVGTQYRSIILYHEEEQRKIAEEVIQELEEKGVFDSPIVTLVKPFEEFYAAEEYHKKYYEKNPGQGYCRFVIKPKVNKFVKTSQEYLKIEK